MSPGNAAAALAVAGVLVIGLAACGSGSSSDSNRSATTVKKEAGAFKGTRLEVINTSPAGVTLMICGDGNCRTETLGPGQSDVMAAGDVGGSTRFQDGYEVNFAAKNPVLGEPYIELRTTDNPVASETVTLSEGETQTTSLNGYSFVGSRAPDLADYKDLTLRVEGKVD